MTEESIPWELRNLTLSRPGMQALQEQARKNMVMAAKFANYTPTPEIYNFSEHFKGIDAITKSAASMILAVQASTQRVSSALLPIVEVANTVMKNAVATQEAAEGLSRIGSAYREVAHTAVRSVTSMASLVDELQISRVQHLADTIKQFGAYEVASSLREISTAFGEELIDLPDFVDVEPYEGLTPEELDAELQKQIEIDKEILGDQVPYNVLSNGFIGKVYLPVLGMADTLESAETFDATFATRFILFSLMPLVCSFISNQSKYK